VKIKGPFADAFFTDVKPFATAPRPLKGCENPWNTHVHVRTWFMMREMKHLSWIVNR